MKIRWMDSFIIPGVAATPGCGGLNGPTSSTEIAEMNIGRRRITEALVDSFMVVEPEVAMQSSNQLFSGRILFEVYVLLLNASPQPFDEHVVQRPPPTVHTHPNPGAFKGRGKGVRSELRSLIGVEYVRSAKAECLLEATQTKMNIHTVGNLKGAHVPAVPVHYGREIHEALPHRHIGDVGAPDLIGTINLEISQKIGIDPMLPLRPARPGFGVNGLESHCLHQPLNPLVVDLVADSFEVLRHSQSTVKRHPHILFVYQAHQLQIESRFLARNAVE